MITVKTDTNNDLELVTDPVTGKRNLSYERDQVVAGILKLYRRFRFFEGEWFLDTRQGVPYYKYFFVKNPDFTILRTLVRKVILSVKVIATVDSVPFAYTNATRTAEFSFEATAVDGRKVSGGVDKPFIVDGKDIHRSEA